MKSCWPDGRPLAISICGVLKSSMASDQGVEPLRNRKPEQRNYIGKHVQVSNIKGNALGVTQNEAHISIKAFQVWPTIVSYLPRILGWRLIRT
jgi:hypothetical protein